MYVVMNELHVPEEAKEAMKGRFGKSADNMKEIPGCLDFLFLEQNEENGNLVVFTKWESKEHYEDWLHSDAFKNAHKEKRESKDKGPASGNELKTFDVVHHL
ncbi:heme oxygenase (staphylobilin-producing) [Alteribacillus persepolensis]|uniref:Heme oxygenase (Staphylobilin-producing) n=1 Tax=Alteribacillus persepolensis TaxID=568899 RepID=A0A1G8D907_9BACI|nr:antibiotic biosynthesis monooxygenase [Alteribacillus persepolensis]SDH54236.1 heme oxygenase (staphylobilin-producing) [Alteribacillus persepolensis]